MRRQHLGHGLVDLGFIAHVAVHEHPAQLPRQRLAAPVVHVGDGDTGVLPRKAPGAGFANALRAASDQADAAGVAEVGGRCVGRWSWRGHRAMVAAIGWGRL